MRHGGYASLLSYRKAEIIYDATAYFCDRFFGRRDRTRDQMTQAARSGKQNIIGLIKVANYLLDRQPALIEYGPAAHFLLRGSLPSE